MNTTISYSFEKNESIEWPNVTHTPDRGWNVSTLSCITWLEIFPHFIVSSVLNNGIVRRLKVGHIIKHDVDVRVVVGYFKQAIPIHMLENTTFKEVKKYHIALNIHLDCHQDLRLPYVHIIHSFNLISFHFLGGCYQHSKPHGWVTHNHIDLSTFLICLLLYIHEYLSQFLRKKLETNLPPKFPKWFQLTGGIILTYTSTFCLLGKKRTRKECGAELLPTYSFISIPHSETQYQYYYRKCLKYSTNIRSEWFLKSTFSLMVYSTKTNGAQVCFLPLNLNLKHLPYWFCRTFIDFIFQLWLMFLHITHASFHYFFHFVFFPMSYLNWARKVGHERWHII